MAICKKHTNCKKVKGNGSFFEIVKCPWCGYEVSTSNIGKWCAKCYCKFKVMDDGYIHFSKDFDRTEAEIWAQALAKCGGMSFGNINNKK